MFIVLALLWLRSHGVRGEIRIRLDNGMEFCGGRQRKLDGWNESLSVFGATLDPIPPGAKHLLALVENAHRSDDEYFLMIHAQRCSDTYAFLDKAQRWQDTWNFYRPHCGLGMKGMTPKEKLLYTKTMVHCHVQLFPVLLLERVLTVIGTLDQFFINSFLLVNISIPRALIFTLFLATIISNFELRRKRGKQRITGVASILAALPSPKVQVIEGICQRQTGLFNMGNCLSNLLEVHVTDEIVFPINNENSMVFTLLSHPLMVQINKIRSICRKQD
jgi:hypothetical protein